jgi:outer membrane protein assembly factor BamB
MCQEQAFMKNALLTAVLVIAGTTGVRAGDWPMWRYDAARSAASPDGIATNLTLLWSRKLPPVRPAWPLEPDQRINFDASYEPVVMGQRLFLGSPNDGSVTAYDTATGEEVWKFFTEGPVRCALAGWSSTGGSASGGNGRVYAGSDDGHLYCLDARTGALLWKVRGAPAERPDKWQVGNGQLVSFWPVRGGPVIVDGVVYFAAGIWPVLGVFMQAIDAETGRPRWTNSNLHLISHVRVDHNYFHDTGLSPQGHLVALRDKLIVPCGRSMPAGLDRATGRLIYYAQGYRNGDSRVAAHGKYAFVGNAGVVNLYDFRETGSRWAYTGTNGPPGYNKKAMDMYEVPFAPYKVAEACDAASAFADGIAYGSRSGSLYAYDLAHVKTEEQREGHAGVTTNFLKWKPPLLWQVKTPGAGQKSGPLIKAGRRLYGHAGKRLMAFETLPAEPRLVWTNDVAGIPSSLVAADGKLFVATEDGGLYCFGEGPFGKAHAAPAAALETHDDARSESVGQLVRTTGAQAGYGLVLGLEDGRLIEELLKQTRLSIIGVDADGGKVDRLRRRYAAAGVYGARVTLHVRTPHEFLFPPYLARLIVSEAPEAAGLTAHPDVAALFNILRPYGGTLALDLAAGPRADFEKRAQGAQLASATVSRDGNWWLLARTGALPGSAPWTHEAADAACSFFSQDDRVRAPLGFLWYGDHNGFTQYHDYGVGVKPQVNGGRVYAIQQHSSKVILFAYDAYTGQITWTNDIPCFRAHARFAAQTNGIYLVASGRCLVFDPETGVQFRSFVFNTEGATTAKDLRVEGDIILVACSAITEQKLPQSYWNEGAYFDSTTLVCLDRQTGTELWRRQARNRFNNAAVALDAGTVFVADSRRLSQAETATPLPAGQERLEATVLALDARTGRERWATNLAFQATRYRFADTWLSYAKETGTVLCGRDQFASALAGKDGSLRWEGKPITGAPLILQGQIFTDQNGHVYDLLTGTAQKGRPVIGRNHGCNYMVGSRHLMAVRDFSVLYGDVDGGKSYHLRNIRSGCSASLIPADGLLNVPNFARGCVCNYAVQTSFALVTLPEVEAWAGGTPLTLTPPPALAPTELPWEPREAGE